ncbi:GNAT family N-acetyltransferase [Phytomonospora sp. NPDC050363]|uniref:GNAT family N-acetyltransferase n=1 Tax=Phytomonospora sp. NPDC050363 TaxID=3155642 RepID=UPI00340668DC
MTTNDHDGGSRRVELRPYAEGDFWILERNNAPEQTDHLGGPETPEKLADRHRRYLDLEPATGMMFVIEYEGAEVGTIGYWEKEWNGETVFETGWAILTDHQGRGLATLAAVALADKARELRSHRWLHAYPSVDHPASNAICRKAGFTLLGEADFEYPKGNPIQVNDWRLDLEA